MDSFAHLSIRRGHWRDLHPEAWMIAGLESRVFHIQRWSGDDDQFSLAGVLAAEAPIPTPLE